MGPRRDELDDTAPSEPPPSYTEAVAASSSYTGAAAAPFLAPPTAPARPTNSSASSFSRPPQAAPNRPSSARPPAASLDTSDLYTANENLPFRYPKGYFCKKCKNSGYKTKYTKYCAPCWDRFYLNEHAYNPNKKLPFKYPKRFFCAKCNNTGTKLKNGKPCKDCYERFASRNNARIQSSSYLVPFVSTTTSVYNAPPVASGPIRVQPGDPRIGGTLCGRCGGSGVTHFLLDTDLCPVCSGVGRILNGAPPQMGFFTGNYPPGPGYGAPPPPPPQPHPPGPYGYQQYRPY